MSIFTELKRRNVFKVGGAYLVGAWLLIQFADILLDNIQAPAWVLQAIMIVLAVGLFITLFFAWAFELTPEGVKRESEVDRSQSITPQTGKKLNTAILVMMALAIAYLLFDKFQTEPELPTQQASQQVEASLDESGAPAAGVSRQSVAVLPFDNRSPNPDDAYFTAGVHDDLLTTLSRISALKVISRTSVEQYAEKDDMSMREIAAELGVAHIMEGAVQRAGNQVRINVQLIDAQTDEHLWAEIFDRELTTENLFVIQSEISQAIADELEATLTSEERQRIDTIPTQSLVAYEAYLRGKQLIATRESAPLEQAISEFETAIELDPQFALAHVGLADSKMLLSSYGTMPFVDAFAMADQHVRQALSIDDGLGEAWASLSQVQSFNGEWEDSEESHQKSIELSPNYATAWHWYSNDLKQFPTRIDQSIELAMRAVDLDPKSAVIRTNLASAYRNKGLFSLAERNYRTTIDLHPDFATAYGGLGGMYYQLGRLSEALEYLKKANDLDAGNIIRKTSLLDLYLDLGDFAAAESIRHEIQDLNADHPALAYADVEIASYENNVAASREAINYALTKFRQITGITYWLGIHTAGNGDFQRARDIMLSVEPGWLDAGHWNVLIERHTLEACVVSWLLIRTGDQELGRQLLAQASEFQEQTLPALLEHPTEYYPQVCQATRGDFALALNTMELMVDKRHISYWHVIHRLPLFDPVRDDPRFIAIEQQRRQHIEAHRDLIEAGGVEAGP
jgi:TolB-like protein/Tfp pilus assembly protein PilF